MIQRVRKKNVAEASVYLKIAGVSDEWYLSKNIKVNGIKNELVQEKLIVVQSACDSIEKDLNQLKFSAVQKAIRDLQAATNDLKSTIDDLKASNPSYQIKVLLSAFQVISRTVISTFFRRLKPTGQLWNLS